MGLFKKLFNAVIGTAVDGITSIGKGVSNIVVSKPSGPSEVVPSTSQTYTIKKNVVVRNPEADFVSSKYFVLPKLRARTVTLAATKMKPGSNIHAFISDVAADDILSGCQRVEITSVVGGEFYGYSTIDYTDNLAARTVGVNNYDVIRKGDVITGLAGTAVVVADETVYDAESLSNKRYLYIQNLQGTLSGTITGSQSGTTATVVNVLAGLKTVNSLGNFYGSLAIPNNIYDSGVTKISISDSNFSDPNSATTYADTSYESNGVLTQYTQHYAYGTRNETTIIDTTTKTANTYRMTSDGAERIN